MDGASHEPNAEKKNGEYDVVESLIVLEVDDPEQASSRNGLQSVFTAGEGSLQIDEVHQLGQSQRDHGEINALPSDDQASDNESQRRRGQGTRENPKAGSEGLLLNKVAGKVAGSSKKRRVTEGEESGVSKKKVECAGEQSEAQSFHQKYRIEDARSEDGRDEHHGEAGEAEHARAGWRRHFSLPNRPAGRTRRTIAMMKKTTVLEA